MLGSYTSGPNGAFLAHLRESAPMKDRVDWMAVDRCIAAGRDHYHDLWESGALPSGELADAIAAFHNLPRIRAEDIEFKPELFNGLSWRFLREAWIFPYEVDGRAALAVGDPTRDEAIRAVMVALGEPAALRVAAFDELAVLFEQGGGPTSQWKRGRSAVGRRRRRRGREPRAPAGSGERRPGGARGRCHAGDRRQPLGN